jgi:general secretion pathway protein C
MFPEALNKTISDRRIIVSLTWLLMAIAGYQMSLIAWKLVPAPEIGNTFINLQQTNTNRSANTPSLSQKVNEITSKNIYGVVQKQVVPTTVVEDAPKSSLNYKLRGIYYSDDESIASIILEKSSNNTQFYRLGDEIDTNIYIHQIQHDAVIISRAGKLEKLILEKPELNVNQASVNNLRLNTRPSYGSTEVLQNYRRRYANNPMALARRFSAIPVQENGRNIGYKLKALRGEQLLKKLNLQEDDVFVAINGIGLDKPFQALDALKSLTTADNVSVTVLRNGNRETLDFNL